MTRLDVATIDPRGIRVDATTRRDRREMKLQKRTERFLRLVSEALDGLRRFWPVTLRQLYYRR